MCGSTRRTSRNMAMTLMWNVCSTRYRRAPRTSRRLALEGGVVDEDVDPAERVDGRFDDAFARGSLGAIAWNQQRSTPGSITRRSILFASACSLRYETATSAPSRAYASATARPIPLSAPVHERHTSGEPAVPAVGLRAVARLLSHLGFHARAQVASPRETAVSSLKPSDPVACFSCDVGRTKIGAAAQRGRASRRRSAAGVDLLFAHDRLADRPSARCDA